MDKERKTPPKVVYYQDPYKDVEEERGLVRLGLNLNL
jgi:hypothetical protein